MWPFSKKPEAKGAWDLTVPEALDKYGSAKAVLDALCKETKGTFDPIVYLMLLERKEKLKRKKK